MLEQLKIIGLDGLPVLVDLVYRTYNKQTKCGGKLKHFNEVRLLKAKSYLGSDQTESEKMRLPDRIKKNPNHVPNRTINIELANGDIETLRIDGIIKFNDKYVMP